MDESGKTEKKTRARRIAAIALVFALAAALAVWQPGGVRVGSRRYRRADVIDAREQLLSVQEYEAASNKYPDRTIRWSVPLGGERFDSFSESIAISSLSEDETENFRYFPNLKTVDARACSDYEALAALTTRRSDLGVFWSIPSADGAIDGHTETLSVRGIGFDELRTLIPLLPRLRALDLSQSALTAEEVDALRAEFPFLAASYTVRLWGKAVPSDCRALAVEGGGDFNELKEALRRLEGLEELDLRGAELSCAELGELQEFFPAETRYLVPLCGARYENDTQEIDISGVPVEDVSVIDEAAALLPRLEKLVMCDCGVPDGEMDALGQRHPTVRFVWTVYFSVYALRTDATVFCASDLPSRGFVAPHVTSEELAPLRYCTDLIALDLGHMFFENLDFLENMKHLKYLILVEERFHDISMIGALEELEYLEIFNNTIDDISPLLNCRNLRHLNIGYTRGYDTSPLWEMTWLERLWYPGNRMGKENCASLKEALADTRCYLPSWDADGSTGGGWRTDEAYYEMRQTFGMFYQPGGTGTGKKT